MKDCIADVIIYECEYLEVLKGKERGVMDADPDEYYCTCNGECIYEYNED